MLSKLDKKQKQQIKPIRYFMKIPNSTTDVTLASDSIKKTISNVRPLTYPVEEVHEVSVSPYDFNCFHTIDTVNDKWFINLSKTQIPKEVQLLLQLGHRFNLPVTSSDKHKYTIDLIKHIEKNIFKLNNSTCNSIRNDSVSILNKINNFIPTFNYNNNMINHWVSCTKIFIKNNPNILFTRADKDNVTVVLQKNDYINRMENMLSDDNTYIRVNKDPLNKLTTDIRALLLRWKRNEVFIDMNTYRKLLITDGILPRAYGLMKIHMENFPLRIIVSSINSPSYPLAAYLHNIIYNSIPKHFSHIHNSFHLVNKLNGKFIRSDHRVFSLDVVSLFTNVPKELICNSVVKRWGCISCSTGIPLNEFIIAVSLIINSTFFRFNNKFYRQIFGTPMGSPLSPILADIVLQDIEEVALGRIPAVLPFYIRYVDDILLAAPNNLLNIILKIFNSFHERLKFTMEVSGGNRINFLDVTLIVENEVIRFDLYRKPTNSGRYLNFFSNHPIEYKKGVILSLFDRTLLLSHPMFHLKNIKEFVEILLQNGYPLELIFSTINNRIRKFITGGINERDKIIESDSTLEKRWFTVPYMKGISESFKNITKKYDFNLAYTTTNSLQKYIKTGKDCLNLASCCGVVYKINCQDCDVSYVGQTKRSLKTRVKEHDMDLKKSSGPLSVISDHRLSFNHDFAGTQILDRESSWYKRSVSEMIHIKRQHHGINKQIDTELLPEIYFPIIRNLPPTY